MTNKPGSRPFIRCSERHGEPSSPTAVASPLWAVFINSLPPPLVGHHGDGRRVRAVLAALAAVRAGRGGRHGVVVLRVGGVGPGRRPLPAVRQRAVRTLLAGGLRHPDTRQAGLVLTGATLLAGAAVSDKLFCQSHDRSVEEPSGVGSLFASLCAKNFYIPVFDQGGKPTPLFPFVAAFIFCLLNGYVQAGHLLKYADLQKTVSQVQFYTGIVVFFVGMAINIHSDHILRCLRKTGESGYKIPFGGMFEYVSGANFLGEMLEWSGFAIMCGTLPTLVFAIFTACNVGPRACHHHRWYLEKFKDYPRSRKALIPYVL
ncbi:3-oxo-5-alpha-steroid 4-dehydrogenase 1-like [Pomacea canaliculata]|uniref:3-oxo-5-alpha-steroid 4-dehydrogenase 1-like n=1 Tax=Pomacea canaliculata TaxID=400727 RepID=UPI000D7371D4|nr:3-oxo-5-alpha-steroid 4-dehydrogenase 1-like [Pomacea canaliculata]